MLMILLPVHILVASIMSVTILGVMAAAYRRQETRLYMTMLGSFALTIVSGIGLLFVTVGSLGRICAMMSAFTLSVVAVRYYYRKQLPTVSSL